MKRINYILLLSLFLLFGNSLFGQRNANKGDRYFDKNLFEEAIKYYELEIKSGTRESKKYAKKQIAECYRIIGEFEAAEKAYRKILKKKKNRLDATNFMNYGKSLKSSAKFEEAKVQFEEYIKLKPDDPMGPIFLKSCDSAQLWLDETMGKTAKNLEVLNTEGTDFAPVFAGEDNLLFSSSREGNKKALISFNGGMEINYLDFYTVQTSSLLNENVLVRNMEEFNTPKHEGPATFSKDGQEMYFTRTVKGQKDKRTGSMVNTLQVFYSKLDTAGNWIEPIGAFPFNSSDYSVGHPSLSYNGDTIYFMSDMPKGFGKTDIYFSTKDTSGVWQFPVNMGNKVNTFGHELFPYVAENGVLYFSSDSHPGMGQLDVFSSHYKNGGWSTPENLKPPVNSIGNDFGIALDGEALRGFFTSDRFNGKGAEDIYSFGEPTTLKVTLNKNTFEFEDKRLFDGLKYKIKSKNLGVDSTLVSSDGIFHIDLESGGNYMLSAKKSVFSTYNQIEVEAVDDTINKTIIISIVSMNQMIELVGTMDTNQYKSITIEDIVTSEKKEMESGKFLMSLLPEKKYTITIVYL